MTVEAEMKKLEAVSGIQAGTEFTSGPDTLGEKEQGKMTNYYDPIWEEFVEKYEKSWAFSEAEEEKNDPGWEEREKGDDDEWLEYQKFIDKVDRLEMSFDTESERIKSGKALIMYKLMKLGFDLEPSEELLTKKIIPVKLDEYDFKLSMHVRDLTDNESLQLRCTDEEIQMFERESALLGIVVLDSLEASLLIVDAKYALRYLIQDGCIDLHYRYLWPRLRGDIGVISGEILREQSEEAEIKMDEKEKIKAERTKQIIDSITIAGANNIYENLKRLEDVYLSDLSCEIEDLLDHLAKTNGQVEVEIIRLKHGFNNKKKIYSTTEIAKKLDLKLIEVEDLYRKGLRMLRHPSRFKALVMKNNESGYWHYQQFLEDLLVLKEKHEQMLNE